MILELVLGMALSNLIPMAMKELVMVLAMTLLIMMMMMEISISALIVISM